MSPDRQEGRIRDAADQMQRDAAEMEQQSAELSEHIEEARDVAAQRPDAPEQTGSGGEAGEPPEGTEDVAGDWRGESSGAQQGEDAEDAEDAAG